MKTFRSHKQKTTEPEGFNPRVYQIIGSVFAVLSLLNLAVVIFAFNRTGYGLYHAEDAVAHVAQIEQCLQSTNESVLNIVVHKNNYQTIEKEVQEIHDEFIALNEEAEALRAIDLSSIDNTIMSDFESAMIKVNAYHQALLAYSDMFKEYDENSLADKEKLNYFMNMIESKYGTDIEPLKDDATSAMSAVVKHQNESTYTFYVKIAQEFLFVIVFMLVTMSVGLNSIHFMKNNARRDAAEIQQKKKDALETAQEASHLRRKAVAIAYTNVLTGLKNRYALEEDLQKRLKTDDMTVAIFNFDNFNELNENYGRNFGDNFLITIADTAKESFSDVFDIYHTDADEFCFVMKKFGSQMEADSKITQIVEMLSGPVEVSKLKVQLHVSGCIYHYQASERLDMNSLFVKIDRTMKEAKRGDEHRILEVNSLYSRNVSQ
ncbi:MAG: GGDEF domain-containing protein [Ruminococcus sp.]|nr:GGDEF domain-containing protein [Ruminococcus sp.]